MAVRGSRGDMGGGKGSRGGRAGEGRGRVAGGARGSAEARRVRASYPYYGTGELCELYLLRTGELCERGAEGEADEDEAARRLARGGEGYNLRHPLGHASLPHGVAALAGPSIPQRVVVIEHARVHLLRAPPHARAVHMQRIVRVVHMRRTRTLSAVPASHAGSSHSNRTKLERSTLGPVSYCCCAAAAATAAATSPPAPASAGGRSGCVSEEEEGDREGGGGASISLRTPRKAR